MEVLALLQFLLLAFAPASAFVFPDPPTPPEGASFSVPSFTGTHSFVPHYTERPKGTNDTANPPKSPSSLHFQCRELDALFYFNGSLPVGPPHFSDGATESATPTKTAEPSLATTLQSLKSNRTLVSLCAAALAVEETCTSQGAGHPPPPGGRNDTTGGFDGEGKNSTQPRIDSGSGSERMNGTEGLNATVVTEGLNATMVKVCDEFAALVANGNMSSTDAALEALTIAQTNSTSASSSTSSTGSSSSSSSEAERISMISGMAISILLAVTTLTTTFL